MINAFHFLGSQKDFLIFVMSILFFPREGSHAPLFLIGHSPRFAFSDWSVIP